MKKPAHNKNDGKASKPDENFSPNSSNLNELTNSAIIKYLQNRINVRNEKRKDVELLKSTVDEFLNSFIILGYTFDGEPVNLMSAHNQQEADSLATLVNKVFIHNQQRDD